MSLETAGFIKDLVSTNPEGTDPKSQGDDHLRMLKAVLKAQFSGLTEGLALTMTETMLNRMHGIAGNASPYNQDTVVPYHAFLPVFTANTGTLPPGFINGDMILNLAYSPTIVHQIYFSRGFRTVWTRFYLSPSWSAWLCQSPLGANQVWTQLDLSRALDTNYTNDTGRSIMVSVTALGTSSGTRAVIQAAAGGTVTGSATCGEATSPGVYTGMPGSLAFIVPAGAVYRCNVAQGTAALQLWRELR